MYIVFFIFFLLFDPYLAHASESKGNLDLGDECMVGSDEDSVQKVNVRQPSDDVQPYIVKDSFDFSTNTLDLHGVRSEAHAIKVFCAYISYALSIGHKEVYIITGRGLHSPNNQGKLWQNLPRWLEDCKINDPIHCEKKPIFQYVKDCSMLAKGGCYRLSLLECKVKRKKTTARTRSSRSVPLRKLKHKPKYH
jgi:hypothetical protein